MSCSPPWSQLKILRCPCPRSSPNPKHLNTFQSGLCSPLTPSVFSGHRVGLACQGQQALLQVHLRLHTCMHTHICTHTHTVTTHLLRTYTSLALLKCSDAAQLCSLTGRVRSPPGRLAVPWTALATLQAPGHVLPAQGAHYLGAGSVSRLFPHRSAPTQGQSTP